MFVIVGIVINFSTQRTEVYDSLVLPVFLGCPPANLTYRQILMYSGISILKQNPNNLGWNYLSMSIRI